MMLVLYHLTYNDIIINLKYEFIIESLFIIVVKYGYDYS